MRRKRGNHVLDPININGYPAVKRYLDSHWEDIKSRSDQGDTPYNLRGCAYLRDFDRDKIVWGNLNLKASYALDRGEYMVSAPSCLLSPLSKAVFNLLNSKLADWYVHQIGVQRESGYYEYKPMFVRRIPIPEDISILENVKDEDIDLCVYHLYGLTFEEAKYIDRSLNINEKEY